MLRSSPGTCLGGPVSASRGAWREGWSYSGPFTEAILSGVVAMRVGERLYWDWPEMRVTNHPGAESLIFPEYHNGWTL